MKLTFVIFCFILLIFGCTSCKFETPRTRFQAELNLNKIESKSFELISRQEIGWTEILEIKHKNGSSFLVVRETSGVAIAKLE